MARTAPVWGTRHRGHRRFGDVTGSLATIYGGGGFYGIGYAFGVGCGLRDGGVPVDRHPALGTSAGTWAAAALALGGSFDDFDALNAPQVPNLQPGLLSTLARDLLGDATHDDVWGVATRVVSGSRDVFWGGATPLADVIAASSAVPAVLPAHAIGGRVYVDGGMRSMVSVDLAPSVDRLIVIAPIGGRLALGGTAFDLVMQRHLDAWRARHPDGDLVVIRPNAAIARRVGLNPMALFDADFAKQIFPLAYEQGLRWADRLRVDQPVAAAA